MVKKIKKVKKFSKKPSSLAWRLVATKLDKRYFKRVFIKKRTPGTKRR